MNDVRDNLSGTGGTTVPLAPSCRDNLSRTRLQSVPADSGTGHPSPEGGVSLSRSPSKVGQLSQRATCHVHEVSVPRRVVGRPAIVRSLISLLLRTHRFSAHRATSDADRHWAARTVDALTDALAVARGEGVRTNSPATVRRESVPSRTAEVKVR